MLSYWFVLVGPEEKAWLARFVAFPTMQRINYSVDSLSGYPQAQELQPVFTCLEVGKWLHSTWGQADTQRPLCWWDRHEGDIRLLLFTVTKTVAHMWHRLEFKATLKEKFRFNQSVFMCKSKWKEFQLDPGCTDQKNQNMDQKLVCENLWMC